MSVRPCRVAFSLEPLDAFQPSILDLRPPWKLSITRDHASGPLSRKGRSEGYAIETLSIFHAMTSFFNLFISGIRSENTAAKQLEDHQSSHNVWIGKDISEALSPGDRTNSAWKSSNFCSQMKRKS